MARCWLFLIFSTAVIGCKIQQLETMDERTAKAPATPDFFASSEVETRSKSNFYFAVWNKDLVTKLADLPISGAVETAKTPFTGSWYPQVYGGTAVKPKGSSTSALQKYDQAFHPGATTAVTWELTNHSVSRNDPSAGWAGHCNGYSASAQRHAEPRIPVKRGATEFSPLDIKALMAEVYMSAKFYFLAGNRCELIESAQLPSPMNRADPERMGDCDDVNPGTFHITISNWIGIQKHVVILDIRDKEQVWKYPHFEYTTDMRTVDRTEAMRLVTGRATGTYVFNPVAVDFRSVAMTVTHATAADTDSLTADIPVAQRTESATYQYILELDAQGRIIGGEWLGQSQQDHPDFVWVALEPTLGDGSTFSANPGVDPGEVIKLWSESVGGDPNKPVLDILDPNVDTGWGHFPKFDVNISGSHVGVGFLGKPLVAGIDRKSAVLSDATLEVKVDGQVSDTVNAAGAGPISGKLPDVGRGIHVLELRWSKAGSDLDVQKVKFHVL